MKKKSKFLGGAAIEPRSVNPDWNVAELIDDAFNAYNAGSASTDGIEFSFDYAPPGIAGLVCRGQRAGPGA